MEELQPHPGFAALRHGRLEISKDHLKRMYFAQDGLASANISGNFYYIKPSGVMLKVISYDNGPDDFSGGLTRSIVKGKIVYSDKQFHQVIGPKYDWGFPFQDGRALVGLGCKFSPPDSEGHRTLLGGSWGYIDRKGNEVVPISLSLEEAEKRRRP